MAGQPPSGRALGVRGMPPRCGVALCRSPACRAVLFEFRASDHVGPAVPWTLHCPACGTLHIVGDQAGAVATTRATIDANLAAAGYLGGGAA